MLLRDGGGSYSGRNKTFVILALLGAAEGGSCLGLEESMD